MCINPNLCIPTGISNDTGKVHYRVLISVRNIPNTAFRFLNERPSADLDSFYASFGYKDIKPLLVPCGQCVECRLHEASMKAIRVVHEMQAYPKNSFITLTYNDKHLPYKDGAIRPTLVRKHIQDFFKRFRSYLDYHGFGKIRYLYAGEYGDESSRPHYHFICFNYYPDDAIYLPQISTQEIKLFKSPTLEKLWPYGFNTVGAVNFHSARYVAQYSLKKQTGVNKDYYDSNKIDPEFVGVSCQPGLGHDFFCDNYLSIVNNKCIIIDGLKYGIPRYYIDLLEKINPSLYQSFTEDRRKYAASLVHDFDSDIRREQIILHECERFRHNYDNCISKVESFNKV